MEKTAIEIGVETLKRVLARPDAEKRLRPHLRESARLYRGLSAAQAAWMRAQVYAGLARCPCDAEILSAAEEDLRSSFSPVLLAAAARCLVAQPLMQPHWGDLARRARDRVELHDVYPDLLFPPPGGCCRRQPKTVLAEIDSLIERAEGGNSDTTSGAEDRLEMSVSLCARAMDRVAFHDQDGGRSSFADLFAERVSLVAFFYTRCMNPQKCSLTTMRMGEAARRFGANGEIGVFGITYDPRFDTVARLAAYGCDRRFPFAANARLLRCSAGWKVLQGAFDLRVGFGAGVVNAHARELFVVSRGKLVERVDPQLLNDEVALTAALSRSGASIPAS